MTELGIAATAVTKGVIGILCFQRDDQAEATAAHSSYGLISHVSTFLNLLFKPHMEQRS